MALRTLAAIVALCALTPASAGASSRPSFPKRVTGTLSGSSMTESGGATFKTDWKVTGAAFRLVHVRFVENTWTGYYGVTGGSVTFDQAETGDCAYSMHRKFDLKKSLPRRNPSTPLYMTRDMAGRDYYDGIVDPATKWTVLESCIFAGDPEIRERTVAVPNLFATGEKHSRIGRAMSGSYVYRDDGPYASTTTTYKWSLRPRR